VLLAQWDVYRIPLAFRLVRRKGRQVYQSEQVLFGQMLNQLILPPWYSKVIVVLELSASGFYPAPRLGRVHRFL